MMIQRILFSVLKQGVDAILENPQLIDDIFVDAELSETELEAIKTLWAAKPPTVKHQYAHTDDDFPIYALILQNEEEAELFLADDGGMIEVVDDPLYGADIKVSNWNHTYQVWVYTEHPDHTVYNYEIAKSIFINANLAQYGLFRLHFSGGDMPIDPRFEPAHAIVRHFTIKASREFRRIDRDSRLGKAFRVEGIHIDKSGSSSDVGGVKTLVTPYAEE